MSTLEANGVVALEESPRHPSGKRTLTDIEVASRLGVSRFTVRSWRLKGVGPRFLKLGRAVRYRPQDVDEYERQALVETQVRGDHGPDVITACAETQLARPPDTNGPDVLDGR